MKPSYRPFFVWTLALIVAIGALAIPKVLPALRTSTAGQTAKQGEKIRTESRKSGSGNDAPLPVSTFVVTPAPFAESINSTGTLRADEGVELQAETNGKVVAIKFIEGAQVKKDDLLLKLNDADLRATLMRATYRRQLAKIREQRLALLLKQKMATQDDYDSALNDVNVQDAEIALTQAQIEKTEIRAPFDGVVGLRYVSTGAYVNATTRIATLQRLDRLKIDFAVPEKYTGRIKVGSPISFSVAGGISRFYGEIYAIDPHIDSDTRTLLIRAICPNGDGRVLPGAFANVSVTLAELKDAILIPAEAVIPGLDEKNVFVMKDGKAERRAVETGMRTARTVHVLSGLRPGDVVITSGLQQMRVGQAVAANVGVAP